MIAGITVAPSVVDARYKADLPAGTQVVNKRGRREDFKLLEHEGRTTLPIQLAQAVSYRIDRRFEEVENAMVRLKRYSEADPGVEICVADERDGQVELRDMHRVVSQSLMMRPAGGECVGSFDVLLDLEAIACALIAHAHAAAGHWLQIPHAKRHLCRLI